MVNEIRVPDLESGKASPDRPKDEMLFDLEPNGSDLDEEGRHAPGGWIAVSIFSCTILAVIAVLVWTIVTSIPKSDSQRSIESDIAAKYNVSAKILDSTPKGMVAGAIGNNLARNSTMSFASMQHNASSSSFEARALPPTRYCDINSDCDWGLVCSDGTCQPGCESQSDCHRRHRCKKGQCQRRSHCFFRKCDKECLQHFYICKKDRDCCSGMCRRSTRDERFKVCQIGTRSGHENGFDTYGEEEEEEEEEKEERE